MLGPATDGLTASRERKARERAAKKHEKAAQKAAKAVAAKSPKKKKKGNSPNAKAKRNGKSGGVCSDEGDFPEGEDTEEEVSDGLLASSEDSDGPEEIGFEDEFLEGDEDYFDDMPASAGPSKVPKLVAQRSHKQPPPPPPTPAILKAPATFAETPSERWYFLSQLCDYEQYLNMLERASEKVRIRFNSQFSHRH